MDSMNFLPIVTRLQMIQDGTVCDVTTDTQWTEKDMTQYDTDRIQLENLKEESSNNVQPTPPVPLHVGLDLTSVLPEPSNSQFKEDISDRTASALVKAMASPQRPVPDSDFPAEVKSQSDTDSDIMQGDNLVQNIVGLSPLQPVQPKMALQIDLPSTTSSNPSDIDIKPGRLIQIVDVSGLTASETCKSSEAAKALVAMAQPTPNSTTQPEMMVPSRPKVIVRHEPSTATNVLIQPSSHSPGPSNNAEVKAPAVVINPAPEKITDADEQAQIQEFCLSILCLTHDSNSQIVHKCLVCSRLFITKHIFMVHAKSHYKSKRNQCKVCGKRFSRSWLLKTHFRTHTGEKPFKCDFVGCGRAFADRSNLRSHSLIHYANERGYKCTNCNRTFAQKRYLSKHMQEVCKYIDDDDE